MSFFRHPYVLNTFTREPESDMVEYKHKFNYLDNTTEAYKRTICAFANTKGGKLVFGVDDNGLVVGMKYDSIHMLDKVILRLNELCRSMTPSIEGKTEIYEIAHELYVLCLVIPVSDTDVYSERRLFKRMNTSNHVIKTVKILTHEDYERVMEKIEGKRSEHIKKIKNLERCNAELRDKCSLYKKEIEDLKRGYRYESNPSSCFTQLLSVLFPFVSK